jgi:hypothetical protein
MIRTNAIVVALTTTSLGFEDIDVLLALEATPIAELEKVLVGTKLWNLTCGQLAYYIEWAKELRYGRG